MTRRYRSNEEIRTAGLEALLRELGPDGLIRFLAQFGVGSGDYTRNRRRLLPDGDLDELAEEIRSTRGRNHQRSSPA